MKKLLVLSLALLLVAFAGMARTDIFDIVIIEGTIAFTGTTINFSPSTSFAVYSPLIYLGYDAGARMTFGIDDTTGDVVITHAGSNKAVSWTASGGFSWAGEFAMNTNKITGAGDPTAAQDVATKAYVDATSQGLKVHAAVACATTANITLSAEQTLDGILTSTDRVLVKNQTAPAENGIYVSAAGSWARAADMDVSTEVAGSFVFVPEGTTLGCTGWTCTIEPEDFTLGTTAMPWSQFSDAGYVTASGGLAKTGNNIAPDGNLEDLNTVGAVTDADYLLVGTGVGALAWETTGTLHTSLGLTIGTNTQAWDADLDTWATLTPTANAQTLVESTNFLSMTQDLSLEIGVDTQAYDADLGALAGVTSAANAIPYFTGSATADVISSSANVVSFLGSANTAAMITALSLTIGTNTQAWDADLDTFATLTPTANAQTLLESTNFLSMTQDLSVVIGVDTQAYDADLGALAGVTSAANAIPYFTGSATADVISSSANVVSFLGSANTAAMITALSLTIGTNTQAWDADLDTFAILTPTANAQTLLESTNFLSMTQDLSVEIGVDTQAYHANLDALSIADNQTITEYAAFDIEEATMDGDDGTGIKIASIDVNAIGVIIAAFVNVTQGYSEAGDTIELVINTTDDIATPVTTLVGATDTSAAHLLAYQPVTGATVLGATSTTNRYVVVGFKDVGNDDSAGANLQGTLIVIYLEQ
jgi:hypothetical protein